MSIEDLISVIWNEEKLEYLTMYYVKLGRLIPSYKDDLQLLMEMKAYHG